MTAFGPWSPETAYAVVVPTIGRPSLNVCLRALADASGPKPARVVLVDDRPAAGATPLPVEIPAALQPVTTVVPGRARGPAAARNTGRQSAGPVPWIVFLDDDVVPGPTWGEDLTRDLAATTYRTAGVAARITVPLPSDRRPTDWERNTAGLATARWITADMAYRREALDAVGGFDERFRRAFREDADLALRLLAAGWTLNTGTRSTTHPVRPADRWVSVRLQAGNADDALMNRLHGPDWWIRADAPRGRLPRHLAVTAAAVAALSCAALRRPAAAAGCAAAWLAGTAELAAARIAPGPRTRHEIVTMALTSVLIPPAATWHWLRGQVRHRATPPFDPVATTRPPRAPREAFRQRVLP
ncbi:glycosyltransferase family 2 protein [Streptomyces sp. PKU-EA00015]|uniref:glycosyltransferase family 2 protein n=1 Tax=Streptomyces sp. PKU-EA00015 TaxID=2748326 RepID=UPI0015A10917|nr:glycosyltransferase family A protein [Streptomyces sp. PKU-EA00015]NWF29097.1 glycosyltransferase family 2 protein [Streptomyces sp. PKU-EA00015]